MRMNIPSRSVLNNPQKLLSTHGANLHETSLRELMRLGTLPEQNRLRQDLNM